MYKKILFAMISLVLLISLTGCREPIELEFAVTETGFPLGFTRMSDGAQINLGMHRSEIESILGESGDTSRVMAEYGAIVGTYGRSEDGDSGFIDIRYTPEGKAVSIGLFLPNWAVSGGFSLGDNIHDLLDSIRLKGLTYGFADSTGRVIDDIENPTRFFIFFECFDEEGKIVGMDISHIPIVVNGSFVDWRGID